MAGASAFLARLRAPRKRPDKIARHESFLIYRGGFYLKLGLVLCALSTLLYALHDPAEGPSGSTWLGYLLGTLSAAIVGWLAWFGVRKRQFRDSRAAAQAWVSAHVYLGLSLLVTATLHSGFQLGWNVHGLAYVLMLIVIVSGIYGIIAYATLPGRITTARGGMEFRAMLDEIEQLNETALGLAEKIDAETHAVVARSVGKVRIGGTAWEQLSGNYAAPVGQGEQMENFIKLKRSELESAGRAAPAAAGDRRRQVTIAFVADQIFSGRSERGGAGGETLQKLLQAIGNRNGLIEKVNRDITLRARQSVWLYLHVPLSVALLAALLAHVFAVYFYW